MYYDNEKVNLLIGLLKAYGFSHVVLCPGSRNAMIVNNIVESGDFNSFPITDERSASFYALGMAQKVGKAAIVVTSGSALLNVAPAVVEAYYQRLSLVVISADRPQEDIDQNVGQTMRQAGALDNYVCRSVNLTDALGNNAAYHHRLLCEAFCASVDGPVHINVPLPNVSECGMVERIDTEVRKVEVVRLSSFDEGVGDAIADEIFLRHERPMIVIGNSRLDIPSYKISKLRQHAAILSEPLADPSALPFADIVEAMADELLPDLIIYIGGTLVCRSINSRFAALSDVEVWRVDADCRLCSPFKRVDKVFGISGDRFLNLLHDRLVSHADILSKPYAKAWDRAMTAERQRLDEAVNDTELSATTVVKYFEEQLEDMFYDYHVHYANSTAVRLACRYASGHKVFCNRGVNGIEGSLSTAAGFSVTTDDKVFCVIGDLSFFYDQNALWNQNLKGNLRIILLNDHHGSIFDSVRGLEQCAHRDVFVSGRHGADARGICTQNDIGYISAKTVDEMHLGIVRLMTEETKRPVVLEVMVKD
ncbi:MAG: 2-succinyl-5-enolpyruvyl-6-hydroxy-3-cyclohexene-1-carboxylic-acid synthase [Prevotella sp.]